MHADQTTLARALKVLENDGLIRRVPNPDKRVKRIALTAAGRKRLAHARRLWTEAQANMVGLIGDAAWKDTRRRLGRLMEAAAGHKPDFARAKDYPTEKPLLADVPTKWDKTEWR